MTDQLNQKPAGRPGGPPAWDECRPGGFDERFYARKHDDRLDAKRHRQPSPSGHRAEVLSGKFDDQARPSFVRRERISNRIGPEEFCRAAFENTGDEEFIFLGNLCRSLAERDPLFAETRISPPDARFLRKNLMYLFFDAKDSFHRLRPEDRHVVKAMHSHIRLILKDNREKI